MDDPDRYFEALQLAMQMLETGARRSGRTERLVERARPGDTFLFLDGMANEADRVQHLLRNAKKPNVRCTPLRPFEPLREPLQEGGRLLLDHSYIAAHFRYAIDDAHLHMRRLIDHAGDDARTRAELARPFDHLRRPPTRKLPKDWTS